MSIAKFPLRGKPIPVITDACNNVVTQMTGNENFDSPDPSLKFVSNAVNSLENAYEKALDGGRALKAAQRAAASVVFSTMSQLVAYVQSASGGDETIIRSSGMDVRKKRGSSKLSIPQNVRTKENNNASEISLLWKAVKGSRSYVIQTTATPETETSWVISGNSTKASITLTGLTSGKLYWVRVAALGAKGLSGWSEAVQKMVR